MCTKAQLYSSSKDPASAVSDGKVAMVGNPRQRLARTLCPLLASLCRLDACHSWKKNLQVIGKHISCFELCHHTPDVPSYVSGTTQREFTPDSLYLTRLGSQLFISSSSIQAELRKMHVEALNSIIPRHYAKLYRLAPKHPPKVGAICEVGAPASETFWWKLRPLGLEQGPAM